MAISFRYLILIISFASLALSAQGQEQSAEKPKEVSLQFTVFTLGELENLCYIPKAKAAPMGLKFYSAYRSSEYVYRGGVDLSFFDGKTGGENPSPVAIYTVPEGARKMLLLFFPKKGAAGTGLKYDVYGVDDRIEKTPAGSFSTINISGREYLAQYGDFRITIPQGVGESHAAKGRVSLRLATQAEGGWKPSGRHDFSMTNQDRVTLIFYPPASGTGIYPIIRRLVDTLPPPEKKPGDYAQYNVQSGDL